MALTTFQSSVRSAALNGTKDYCRQDFRRQEGKKMYQATDDDLPEYLFNDRALPEPPKIDPRKRAEVAVLAHYPEIRAKRLRKQEQALRKAQSEEVQLQEKKVFVKLSKKLQMWDWLLSLEKTCPIMRQAEAVYITQMLEKFRRYTPYGVKWITKKQYEWLKFISVSYLRIPNDTRKTT